MSMTRKDYILIADAIFEGHSMFVLSDEEKAAVGLVCASIARALHDDNPRFDVAKFMAACGFGGAPM